MAKQELNLLRISEMNLQTLMNHVNEASEELLGQSLPTPPFQDRWGFEFRDLLENSAYSISDPVLSYLRRQHGGVQGALTSTSLEALTLITQELCVATAGEARGTAPPAPVQTAAREILVYLSNPATHDALKQRVYVGRFVGPVRIPPEHANDADIIAAQAALAAEQASFQRAYAARARALALAGDPALLAHDLWLLENQREALQQRVSTLTVKLPPAALQLEAAAAAARAAEHAAMEAAERQAAQETLLEQAKERYAATAKRVQSLGYTADEVVQLASGGRVPDGKVDATALAAAVQAEHARLTRATATLPAATAAAQQRLAILRQTSPEHAADRERVLRRDAEAAETKTAEVRARTRRARKLVGAKDESVMSKSVAFVAGEEGTVGGAEGLQRQVQAYRAKLTAVNERADAIQRAITALDAKFAAVPRPPNPCQLDFKLALAGFKPLQAAAQADRGMVTRLAAEKTLLESSAEWLRSLAEEHALDLDAAAVDDLGAGAGAGVGVGVGGTLDAEAAAEVARVIDELRAVGLSKQTELAAAVETVATLRDNIERLRSSVPASASSPDATPAPGTAPAVVRAAVATAEQRSDLHEAMLQEHLDSVLARYISGAAGQPLAVLVSDAAAAAEDDAATLQSAEQAAQDSAARNAAAQDAIQAYCSLMNATYTAMTGADVAPHRHSRSPMISVPLDVY